MTASEADIDPALRDVAGSLHGVKRKGRHSGGVGQSKGTGTTHAARLTRRQAAAAAVASTTTSAPPARKEPARGEEENLIKYDWDTASKRQRRSSPAATVNPVTSSAWPDAPAALPSTTTANTPTLQGIENLAAAAAAFQAEPPPPYQYHYPFGMTPFRYPCHKPLSSPPPPGDPNDPRLRRFDPSYSSGPPADDFGFNDAGDAGSPRLPAPLGALGDQYTSLSSLLAASQVQFSGTPGGWGRDSGRDRVE